MREIPTYRDLKPGEERKACDFVARVFNDFIASSFSQEGVRGLLSYVLPDLLRNRRAANHFVLAAELRGRIVGLIEVRNCDHISLFFVEGELQRKGIGKHLWHEALERCRVNRPDLTHITVHSSPNAVEAYSRLGFEPEGPEQTVKGIRFVSMALPLGNALDAASGPTPGPSTDKMVLDDHARGS
jgi:GNAT superfamily N-acetyltransferase